jgi:hypothetical protein
MARSVGAIKAFAALHNQRRAVMHFGNENTNVSLIAGASSGGERAVDAGMGEPVRNRLRS